MSSLGTGVNLDASATPIRITYFDDTVADAQDDGYTHFQYDLHKIWACIGRVGSNAVMRVGFVEEGDPYNGWLAGHIEEAPAGVYGGVDFWNSLTGYNPLGGINAGDFCIYGALSPFTGVALHLGAPLAAQPTFVAEYWNGAAWTALTIVVTPDFTQANGKALQRCEWLLPATWGGATALGAGSAGQYYHVRLYLTAGPMAAPAVANQNYKDWLYGHFKFFYSYYDLKRGDDSAGSNTTEFRHEGNFGLRFRSEKKLDGSRASQSQPVQMGQTFPLSNRGSPGAPWYVVASVLAASYRGHKLYGGAFMGRAHQDATISSSPFIGAGGVGELEDFSILGYGQVGLGNAGSGAMDHHRRVTVAASVTAPSSVQVIRNMNTVNEANDIVVLKPQGIAMASGYLDAVNSDKVSRGITFTHDDFTNGQIEKQGTGVLHLFGTKWGGPTKKVSVVTFTEKLFEWRFCPINIHDGETGTPPAPGIPFRITGSGAIVQASTAIDGATFDVNGVLDYSNSMGLGASPDTRNALVASEWTSASSGAENSLEDFTIEINPSDLPGWDPLYKSLLFKYSFPRAVVFNPLTSLFEIATWQRTDGGITIGLPRIDSPTAGFSYDPKNGPAPLAVYFVDESTGGGITSWLWDFGDGETSTLQNPSHTYSIAGFYVVTLTVTSLYGSDSQLAAVSVGLGPGPVPVPPGYTHRTVSPTEYVHRP